MFVTTCIRKRSGRVRGYDGGAFARTEQRKGGRVRNVHGNASLTACVIGAVDHIC